MPGMFKQLASIFTYKEPKNDELGFELLEDENESAQINTLNTQNANKIQNKDNNLQNNSHQQDSNQQQRKEKQHADAQQINNTKQQSNTKQESANQQNNEKQQSSVQSQKKGSGKQPLTVEEWNESRRTESENKCQAKSNSDEISTELCVNLETIRQKFLMPKNQDIVIREFKIGRKIKAFIVYIEGMVDTNTLNLAIFPHLMSKEVFDGLEEECLVDYLVESVLTVNNLRKTNKYSDVVMQVLNGLTSLFVEGCDQCILIETRGFEKRNIEQPITETVVKGSQEGFTENLRTNVTQVRRIVKNENLVTEMLQVGSTNHSNCAVMYLDGVANAKVIKEVEKRLKSINKDFILGDGMIEQFIEDNPYMLFPQVLSTERPDRCASFLMEGQVVIIAEGTPFALAVPVSFFGLFHTSEDSAVRWPGSNFLRLIRLFGLFCATFLPGLYVALTLYHVEMVPTELLLSIARAKELVPFPTLLEVLMMEVSFELIREGGIRVPSVIGQTLGIVGALILGQAAVTAGLISPLLVIVVSITALGSFAIPNYTLALAIRIERFLFIAAGAFLGFYGISLMLVLLAFYACSMKSFGVPYFVPIAPKTKVNHDVVFRNPITVQKNRPDAIQSPNRRRQGDNVKKWADEKAANNVNEGEKT